MMDELERLRLLAARANQLRSNIIASQSASWSNSVYPLVAMLNDAGLTLIEDVTDAEKLEHRDCYGGAGGMPTTRASLDSEAKS